MRQVSQLKQIRQSVIKQVEDKHEILIRDVEEVCKDAALLKEWVGQLSKTISTLSYDADFKLEDGVRYTIWNIIDNLEGRAEGTLLNAKLISDIVKSEDIVRITANSSFLEYRCREIMMDVNIIAFGARLLEDILLSNEYTAEKVKDHNLLKILKDIKSLIEYSISSKAMKLRDTFNKIYELMNDEYMNVIR